MFFMCHVKGLCIGGRCDDVSIHILLISSKVVSNQHNLSLPFGGGVSHRLTEGGLMYSYLSLSPTPSRLHRDTPPKEGALDCANSFVCTNETSPWRGREAAYTKPLPPGEVAAKPTERDDEDKDFRISWFVQTILVCADHFICAKVYVSFSPSVSPPM